MQLLHGDCLELMKSIPDGSVDMVLCDPPYGTTACKWDSIIPFDKMWEQLNRIIKRGGVICLFGSEPFSSALRMSNINNYRYDWIWIKNNSTGFQMANKRPLKKHEIISVFYENQGNYFPQGVIPFGKINRRGSMGDNWGELKQNEYVQEYTNYPNSILKFDYDVDKLHSTQKPIPLLQYLIKTYTVEGERVLDFTMGSGSTGVACKCINRKFIGIEKDDKYFEIAKQRIENGFVQEDVNINENSPLFE